MGLDAGIEAGIEHFGRAWELESGESVDGSSDDGGKRSQTEPRRMMGEFLEKKGRGRALNCEIIFVKLVG